MARMGSTADGQQWRLGPLSRPPGIAYAPKLTKHHVLVKPNSPLAVLPGPQSLSSIGPDTETVAAVVRWPFFQPQPAEVAHQSAERVWIRLELELDRDCPRLLSRRNVLQK